MQKNMISMVVQKKNAAKMIDKKLVSNISIYIVFNDKFDSFTTDVIKNSKTRKEFLTGEYKVIMIGKDLEIFHEE
ncbi:hypothetical protein [Fontibacillus sp. BL9]|uniref:hypothetical protein n=1 Tax=Fontibacillus sp. BL9 TaxID=3389971 RepID=UPI0039780DA0